jgi:hypothetical protein
MQEIEMREVVTDPLKAAPVALWPPQRSVAEIPQSKAEGAELWSFASQWQTTWVERNCGVDTRWSRRRSGHSFSDGVERHTGRREESEAAPAKRALAIFQIGFKKTD